VLEDEYSLLGIDGIRLGSGGKSSKQRDEDGECQGVSHSEGLYVRRWPRREAHRGDGRWGRDYSIWQKPHICQKKADMGHGIGGPPAAEIPINIACYE